MRICPKCGDYYADGSLAFCFADGTPLVSVDPGSQKWDEGARVIEKKANELSKQKRRLKWRRISLSTMIILTVVAFVLAAAHSRFYLEPPPPPPPPSPTQTPTPAPPWSPTPTPALYKVNGRVMDQDKPLSGVKIMLSGAKLDSTTTDAHGKYTFSNLPAAGSYTITPQPGATMSFNPPSRSIDKLTKDESADFNLVPPVLYKITGQVLDTGKPLRDVSIQLSDGSKVLPAKTDQNGQYAFNGLPAGGSYTITPSKPLVVFNPLSRSINKLTKDESADFTLSKPVVYKITGQVMDASPGKPAGGIKGVQVVLKGGAGTAPVTTDENGRYTFSGLPAGGTYTVTPDRKGMDFGPGSRTFKNLAKDEKADFSLDRRHATPTPTPNQTPVLIKAPTPTRH